MRCTWTGKLDTYLYTIRLACVLRVAGGRVGGDVCGGERTMVDEELVKRGREKGRDSTRLRTGNVMKGKNREKEKDRPWNGE